MSRIVDINRLIWRQITGAEWEIQTFCSDSNVYGWIRKRRATDIWQVLVPPANVNSETIDFSKHGTFISIHHGEQSARTALKEFIARQTYD